MDRNLIKKKYNAQIVRIAEKNKVDLGVALDMFIADIQKLLQAVTAAKTNWYLGIGFIDFDEAITDMKAYQEAVTKRKK